ncbi:ion channel protein [Streptomyces sp. NPDC047000]|uniref:ion channel protein n=1 Tax=Streptomyces sp. NPDC047000 TaxID=3155474 RepID=UPI0034092C6C
MPTDPAQPSPTAPATPARVLLPLIPPALIVGVASSLVFILVSGVADRLQGVLWRTLPDALGVGRYSAGWMVTVLTATGVLVGLVVWLVPGHAGPDPATTGLEAAPQQPSVLPSVALAGVLVLAGGVSLGPENPIIAVNVGLTVWLGRRLAARAPDALWVVLAEAATIGALFGTPVGAALVVSEALAGRQVKGLLWDNVFAPLIAATTGALTVTMVSDPSFDLDLPPFGRPGWTDVLTVLVVASVSAVLGMAAVYAFPRVHGVFARLGHPMAALTLGGLLLGLLGVLGGRLTLFKGAQELAELAHDPEGWSAGQYATMTVVKLIALVVAGTCGFRGGRIFPAVFAGGALGLCAHALVSAVHPAVGVAAGVLGMLLAITRQAWLSLFTAAVLVASPMILALLCIASLPAWLLVTGRPQMQVREDGSAVR